MADTPSPVTIENAEKVEAVTPRTTHKIEHLEASALPELSWFWRRWYVFAATAVVLAITWRALEIARNDPVTVRMIARYALWCVFAYNFTFVTGATATDVVKLLAAWKTTRKETITTGPGQ